eukprot:gene11306-7838_t
MNARRMQVDGKARHSTQKKDVVLLSARAPLKGTYSYLGYEKTNKVNQLKIKMTNMKVKRKENQGRKPTKLRRKRSFIVVRIEKSKNKKKEKSGKSTISLLQERRDFGEDENASAPTQEDHLAVLSHHQGGVGPRGPAAGGPLFSLPSLIDSRSFTHLVHQKGAALQEAMVAEALQAHPQLLSRAFAEEMKAAARRSCEMLLSLRQTDVERIIWEKYGLQDERLMTCLVPYQYAVNIILARLPPRWKEVCLRELREMEEEIKRIQRNKTAPPSQRGAPCEKNGQQVDPSTRPLGGPDTPHQRYFQWRDDDIYVSTGKSYIQHARWGQHHSRTSRGGTRRGAVPRIPVVAILGHEGHGKTTLLARLQQHAIPSTTPGGHLGLVEPHLEMTQTIRSFTIPEPGAENSASPPMPRSVVPSATAAPNAAGFRSCFTFLDTPGHGMFVEPRYFSHLLSDYVILVISLVEGLQSQTFEAIKVGLNVDKPIIVVFTKTDALTDSFTAKGTLERVLHALHKEGLDVTMVKSTGEDIAKGSATTRRPQAREKKLKRKLKKRKRTTNIEAGEVQQKERQEEQRALDDKDKLNERGMRQPLYRGGDGSEPMTNASERKLVREEQETRDKSVEDRLHFAPMKQLSPSTFKGSIYTPRLNLRRRCYGVCVSAVNGVGISQLWELLRRCRAVQPATCLHASIPPSAHNAVVQAAVLDASKHLFNEEEFRLNPQRQKLQQIVDLREAHRKAREEQQTHRSGGLAGQMFRLLDAAHRKATSSGNRTSTNCLVLHVLVQEGVVEPGMHFVADQAEGKVEALLDYWGRPVPCAVPGMAVTLVDLHSQSGCPGPLSHVLSVTDMATRFRVQRYRQMLQWYVEAFPHKLHLLRPRGMDTTFRHLGNYGQVGVRRDSLEAQLLYGRPQSEDKEEMLAGGQADTDASPPLPPTDSEKQQLPKPARSAEAEEEEMTVGEYLMRRRQEEEEAGPSKQLSASPVGGATGLSVSGPASALSTDCWPTPRYPLAVGEEVGRRTPSTQLLPTGAQVTLEHTWRSLQPETPCSTQAEYSAFLQQCLQVGVLLKVDSWYSARMLCRELRRWGTSKVALDVVGTRFGALTVEDILFFGQAAKIIVCYRTPRSDAVDLDNYIETQDTWVLQTDNIQDVGLFAKWCAVSLHKKQEEEEEQQKKVYSRRKKDALGSSVWMQQGTPGATCMGARCNFLIACTSVASFPLVFLFFTFAITLDLVEDAGFRPKWFRGRAFSQEVVRHDYSTTTDSREKMEEEDFFEERPSSTSFEEIHRLISIFPKPLIGLKAYAGYITNIDPENQFYRDACFYDSILRCNAYALREIQSDRNAVEAARDYFHLALQLFAEVKEVCYNGIPGTSGQAAAEENHLTDLSVRNMSQVGMSIKPNPQVGQEEEGEEEEEEEDGNPIRKGTLLIPNSVEDGALTLLAITFNNWACVELSAKNSAQGFALFDLLNYFSPSSTDDASLLGYRVDTVTIINNAVREIMRCNFPEAASTLFRLTRGLQEKCEELREKVEGREESQSGFISITEAAKLQLSDEESGLNQTNNALILTSNGEGGGGAASDDASEGTSSPILEDEMTRELWDVHTLQALASYVAGVADEYPAGEDAEVHYADALRYFTQAGISADADAPRSYLVRTLQLLSQKLSSVLSDAKERAERETADNQNRKDSKKKGGKGDGKKKAKGGKNKHVVPTEKQHYTPPPIQSALRTYIRNTGLPVVPAMLFRLDDALRLLLPVTGCTDFVSPLCGAQVDEHYYVVSAMVPTETPLQWAIEVAARNKSKQRHSVWTPRTELPGYLKPAMPEAPERPEKMKMPRPMVRELMPRPLPQSTIDQAEQGLNVALKLVTNRLATLIKTEKAFEDRWSATERIKNALYAYYVPQMMMNWKETMIDERNFKKIQQDHAARVLQDFFRLVVEVKPRQFGFKSAPERREQEQHDAAVVLQKYARRWMALRERVFRESLRAERKRRITVIQNLWRRLQAIRHVRGLRHARDQENEAERMTMAREFAAIQIQSTYRRHLTQLLLWRYNGETVKALLHHLRASRHYYATVIQKHIRGALARIKYGKAVHARICYGRNTYWSSVYHAACVQIQRIFRGWRTRRRMRRELAECRRRLEERQAQARADVVEVIAARRAAEVDEKDQAASRIQSLARMVLAKQQAKDLKQEREERLLVRQDYIPAPFSLKDCEY